MRNHRRKYISSTPLRGAAKKGARFLAAPSRGVLAGCALFTLMLLAGCATDRPAMIQRSAQALDSDQPNQAIAEAQQYLAGNPTGSAAAEAWYLIGQGYEQRAAANTTAATNDLHLAHAAYERGLGLATNPGQQGHLHAGLANISFFLGNYSEALQQWSAAYNQLTDHETLAWTLYRIGLCRQRLGRFTEADRTFALVQQNYADTPAAARAAEKSGYRNFYVQIGVYANQSNAYTGFNQLRQLGIPAQIFRNAQGQHVVCAGPANTYAQATQLQAKLASHFSGTIVVP